MLQDVADRAAFIARIRQTLLGDMLDARLGPLHGFTVDTLTGTFSFTNDDGDAVPAIPTFIASVAPKPRTMVWGWALPDALGADRFAVERLGQRFGLPGLTTPGLDFAADATNDHDETAQLSHLAGIIAIEAIREGVYYSIPAPEDARITFHLRGLNLPEPTLDDVRRVAPDLVGSGMCQDMRSSVFGLAEHCGWHLEWKDAAGERGVLHDTGGNSILFAFSPQGQLIGME